MRFRLVGCALAISCLAACDGRSAGDRIEDDTAGSAGVSASTGGSLSGASGSSTDGNRAGAGTGGGHTDASGGAASSGPASGGSSSLGGSLASDGGSASSAGESAVGGSANGGNSSGTPWCPELGVCKRGIDQRLAPGEACPVGRDCYADKWCGQNVQCAKYVEDGTCTEKPTCDPEQMSLPSCLSGGICETRSACGKRVMCETFKVGSGCQPGLDKHYVYAAYAEDCPTFTIYCPAGSSPFVNDCGCGCEQPADCPDWVDCMPTTGSISHLCSTSAECPFTDRAQ